MKISDFVVTTLSSAILTMIVIYALKRANIPVLTPIAQEV